MTLSQFRELSAADVARLSPLLQALWHDGRGDWTTAHELAQEVETRDGAWVHAYLHRREGDVANAGYWYRRAARPICSLPLADEWNQLALALLES